MSDEEAIRQVLAQYCLLLDMGDFDGWAELYEEDAVFAVPAANSEVRGREAIRRWMSETYQWVHTGRHMVANPIIKVDGDRAKVVSEAVFFLKTPDGPQVGLIGLYRDVFHKADAWRFLRRESDLDPSWLAPSMNKALSESSTRRPGTPPPNSAAQNS
jgi:uncharacterized protein (TIGR02246 family)